jgi:hypothetical protein
MGAGYGNAPETITAKTNVTRTKAFASKPDATNGYSSSINAAKRSSSNRAAKRSPPPQAQGH